MTGARTLPISARLTIAFAAAMTVVLAVTSLWVYERQRDGYRASADAILRDRSNDAQQLIVAGGAGPVNDIARGVVATDIGRAQVFDAAGGVLAATPALGAQRMATRAQVARARKASTFVDGRGDTRILIERAVDGRTVLAFVESTRSAHEALERLAAQLVAGAVVAVLLGALLAFSLARAALRPVERLRSEAASHGRADDDVVLDVPPARDEVARLAVTLNELLARMRAATLRERRFVAEAGHELRTPLATIRVEIELALEGDPDPDIQAMLQSLHDEVMRLAHLAERLLQLATVGDFDMRESTDVVALVRRSVERARAGNSQHHVAIIADELAPVLIDPARMTQAVDNLLDNAVVHGGFDIEVCVSADSESIHVRVRDDGPGIDAATAARAFDRFARAPDARARRGSGLGLSIVRAVALAHGGDACIRPRADAMRGTEATITIAREEEARGAT